MPLEKIPPARARFPCDTCGEPMDFPSRDQARTLARLQAEAAVKDATAAELERTQPSDPRGKSFRVDKRGWEDDYFDRRGVRNLIRTGELVEGDRVFFEGNWLEAGKVPELKSLFDLRRSSKFVPPRGCRTHTDRIAHFACHDTGRPLCEECAPERKVGSGMVRVCAHCGGTVDEGVSP
jgi:hypothetical protein